MVEELLGKGEEPGLGLRHQVHPVLPASPQVSNDRSAPLLSAEAWRPMARPPNPTNRQAATSLDSWQEGPTAPRQTGKQVSSHPSSSTFPPGQE